MEYSTPQQQLVLIAHPSEYVFLSIYQQQQPQPQAITLKHVN